MVASPSEAWRCRKGPSVTPNCDSGSDRSLSPNGAAPSKRTRVLVSQSKRGCLTCKARRVKCDEQKPLCRRCVSGGRLCGGYGANKKTSPTTPRHSSAQQVIIPLTRTISLIQQPSLHTGVSVDPTTERLSHLAIHVLSLDVDGQPLPTDGVWGRIFLQFSHQVDCVKAAAAAFGASYELWYHQNSPEYAASAWKHYGTALARLRSALAESTTRPETIAVASLILACAEILTQHETNALSHFFGAVQIVHKSALSQQPESPELAGIKNELVKADILIGIHGMAHTPQIALFAGCAAGMEMELEYVFESPRQATNATVHCLYRVRQFIDSLAKLQYVYPSWASYDTKRCAARSELSARCLVVRDGLARLAENLIPEATSERLQSCETLADIYGLRTQITSTLLYILCIHDPFQTLYDNHLDLFQSIISDAAASTRLKRRVKGRALKRFSTRPGVISALTLVSMKCRDPSIRALATTMLKEQGREGPNDGHIMAAIVARMAELERADVPVSGYVSPPSISDIFPEERRIHYQDVFPQRTTTCGSQTTVTVTLSRPSPPLAQGWGTIDYTNIENWASWSEVIEL